MYPVLKIMHMQNFLDTFSVGVTKINNLEEQKIKEIQEQKQALKPNSFTNSF